MSDQDNPQPYSARIDAALIELRAEATAALERLAAHRDRAAQLRSEAAAEARAYATEYRAIRARGFFTAAQLRELGFTAPRTRNPRRSGSSGR
ncbi:hypothetical protein [Mycobacterium sp. 1274756.6]|uniref:hypothetical protein n=1 Tax=Mycobacterium sp. 1274756.6 TaxID=1834076 RepID=UPI0007FFE635|nr:hypothetical protein [Mycobacterium sp. 1274756.6]OBJ73859.1 hypothetical protein A5643_00270 [Mycobacterium sp. 1274756.6]